MPFVLCCRRICAVRRGFEAMEVTLFVIKMLLMLVGLGVWARALYECRWQERDGWTAVEAERYHLAQLGLEKQKRPGNP